MVSIGNYYAWLKQKLKSILKRKQPAEVFCKIHRKTPVPESLFNKVAGLKASNFINKETLAQVFSSKFCEISKNTFSAKHLQTSASD